MIVYFLFRLQAVSNVTALAQVDREKIYQWINELSSPETRENALLELSKKRESVPDLAPMLWHSCGTIAALLQVYSLNCCSFTRCLFEMGPVPLPRRVGLTLLTVIVVGNSEHLPVDKSTDAYGSPV